jgi:hypothetical protein
LSSTGGSSEKPSIAVNGSNIVTVHRPCRVGFIFDGTAAKISDNRKLQECEMRTISLRFPFCEDPWTSGKPSSFLRQAKRPSSRHSLRCMPG